MPALTSERAREIAALRKTKGQRNPRKTIIEVQSLLLKDIRNQKTSPAIRAKCVIAYDKLEDRLRILAGKPLPGQFRPDGSGLPHLERKRARAAGKGPSVLPLPSVDPDQIDQSKESLLTGRGGGTPQG